MSTENPIVWQMAAGDKGRFYDDLFLKHDVMFLGPGKFGSYDDAKYRRAVQDGFANKGIVSNIKNFHDKVQPDQIVLMRKGRRVEAIGIVADGGYEWNKTFDDVHGWSLEHTRRVIWQEHLNDDIKQIQAKNGGLFASRNQTFTRVNTQSVLAPLRSLFPLIKHRPLKQLPPNLPDPLTLDEVGQNLFARGVAYDAVGKVIAAIEMQRRLLRWYERFGKESKRPSEHEVVAHIVLPLLIALGWSEQLLGVEWKKIDLAAFWDTPTTNKNCVLVCEAKKRDHGLQNVGKQAFNYVSKLKLDACRKVLLTDGGRFYLFGRRQANGAWDDQAIGYLNVEKIRTNHIAPTKTNAIDTIVALTPAAVGAI